ncbi:hypothetical protein M0Q03_04060 [bacterium]|nr:hypothetical protein [bacterium]
MFYDFFVERIGGVRYKTLKKVGAALARAFGETVRPNVQAGDIPPDLTRGVHSSLGGKNEKAAVIAVYEFLTSPVEMNGKITMGVLV